jgi:hypothetical protein
VGTRRVIEVAYRCATPVQFEKSVDQRIGRTLGSGPSLCLYSREVRRVFLETGLPALAVLGIAAGQSA